jgi:tetratricopeptide (TPR) repeat protein
MISQINQIQRKNGVIFPMPMMTPKEAYFKAQEIYSQGRYRSAVKMTEQLYRQLPHHTPVVILHVSTLVRLFRAEEASTIARRALTTITNNQHRTRILTNLANAMNHLNSFDEAAALLRDECDRRPDDPYLTAALAHALVIQNKHEEALQLTEAAMERGINHLGIATEFGRAAIKSDRRDEAIDTLSKSVETEDEVSISSRASAYTVLGHLYDKAKRYDEAFDAYSKRNQLYTESYDDEHIKLLVKQLKDSWLPESFEGVPRPKPSGPRPVFIIGMPRSGTTLTEQILSAHPEVFGAGELETLHDLALETVKTPQALYTTSPGEYDPKTVAKFAEQYRNELVRISGSNKFTIISDKSLGNIWTMGLIALAFPDAKIVHCLRDPRDTCLSCFFQPLELSHAYSFDLKNCGSYYHHYLDLVQHMTKVLKDPRVGIDVLEMHYEDTVADQESQTRRLLDFAGLDFHEDCLKFYQSKRIAMTLSNDQVRNPIYKSSTKRHERYAGHIGPLVEALGDLIE